MPPSADGPQHHEQSTDIHPSATVASTDNEEPTTGVQFWHQRRAAWLVPTHTLSATADGTSTSTANQESGSKAKEHLERILAEPLSEENDAVWTGSVSAVWKGLVRGDKLKRSLPLPLVIKILRGGWIRDGTWPASYTIPEDDIGVEETASRAEKPSS